jgi:hypothetical protein
MAGVTPPSPGDLEEIARLALELHQGNSNHLKEWLDDGRFTLQAKMILDSSDVPFHAGFFALQVLQSHVRYLFDFCSISDQLIFMEWFNGLMLQNPLLLEDPQMLALYSKLYGIVFSKGWNLHDKCQSILISNFDIFSGGLVNSAFLSVLGDIASYMSDLRVIEFQHTGLATFLRYGFDVLALSGNESEALLCLKVIHNSLSYYLKLKRVSSDTFSGNAVPIPPDCLEICLNDDHIRLLFEISTKCHASLCFDTLSMLAVIHRGQMPHPLYIRHLISFLECLLHVPMDLLPDSLFSFSRLLLRLQLILIANVPPDLYPIREFVKFVFGISMAHISSDLTKIDSIRNLLKFWGTFDGTMIADFDMIQVRIAVVKTFLEKSLIAIEEDPSSSDALGLSISGNLDPIYRSLRPIGISVLPELVNHFVEPLFTSLQASLAGQVAFLCNCVMGLTIGVNLFERLNDHLVETFQKLYNLLLDIYRDGYLCEFVVNSLFVFVSQLPKMSFLAEPFFSPQELLEFVLRLLWELIGQLEEPTLIRDALAALQSLLDAISVFARIVFGLPLTRELLQSRFENPFPFLENPKFASLRTELHRSLATIIVREDFSDILRVYSGNFGDEGFLCDFRGFFLAAGDSREYAIFFDFVFRNLSELSQICVSEHTVIALVKMWAAMLNNDRSRIRFRPHSPNGIILFRHTTDLLCSLFETANLESAAFVKNCVRIMQHALSADYVAFAAFDLFRDDSLSRMLHCYERATSSESIDHPKIAALLQELNCTIVHRHIDSIVCPNLVVSVISSGLRSFQAESVGFALEAMKDIAVQFGSIDGPILFGAVWGVWHLCLVNDRHDAMVCLAHIVGKEEEFVGIACQRMKEMVIPERERDFEALCQRFIAELGGVFGSDEGTNAVVKALDAFIAAAKRHLRAPHRVFDISGPSV